MKTTCSSASSVISCLVACVLLLGLALTSAEDMYLVNMRGSCKVDGDPKPATIPLTTASILEHHGAMLETPIEGRNLRLVYRPEADRISIIETNGTVVCDYLIFALSTVLSNTVDTARQRFAFAYGEASSDPIGSAWITEKITRDGEGVVTKFAQSGKVWFTQPGTEETGPELCSATFTTGKKYVPATNAAPATAVAP